MNPNQQLSLIRASYVIPTLPLFGYVIFLAESIFGTPNPKWVFTLFIWSLCAVFITSRLIKGDLDRLFQTLKNHSTRLVIVLIMVAAVTAVSISVLQAEYFTMSIRARDMAYYNQILWNTLHGDILAGNLNQELLFKPPVSSDFALHVSPFLFCILPIYALSPHFLTLLIIRDLALAGAAWPLFLTAREYLGGVGGIAAVVLYFVNPAVMAQSFQEFTPLQLAPLPFFFALRAFTRDDLGKFILWMLIAISMREDVAVTMLGFGAWALLKRRALPWVVVGLGIPLVCWGLATLLVQPAFGRWGNNISEISLAGGSRAQWGIYQILDPLRALDVLRAGGLHYLYRLLRSVAFLPVLGIEGVLATPVLVANLFYGTMSPEGINPTLRLALLPSCALIGVTIIIVSRIQSVFQESTKMFALVLLLLMPSASLLDGVKDTIQEGLRTNELTNDADALWKAVGLVPDSASVAAPEYALPAFSKRSKLYNLGQLHMYPDVAPEYILVDRNLDRVTANVNLQLKYTGFLDERSRTIGYDTVWEKGEYSLLRQIKTAVAH